MSPPPLTLGTAGHIDHGKTALIRALTGVDTDRLPQERERGISIELGYASMALPSGRSVSVVDVPGHERFVRTMVAGATGIDLYLMVVAADDGVMPQTREHASVLKALDVHTGVVAITKADLADPEPAADAARELMPDAEAVVATSARSGAGLDDLRAALDRAAAALPGRADRPGAARLHIDRVFTIRGAGTVVTGTLWSGSIARGEHLTLLPAGVRVRVRGVQIHDRPAERAAAGQRVAVNVTGASHDEISRGDVLAGAGTTLTPTFVIDVALEVEPEPDSGTRVQVHHGTRETPARLARVGDGAWKLRLERPLLAAAGDRLVIRRIAPPGTLGGGVVSDARRAAEATPPQRPEPDARPPLSERALALEDRLRAAGLEPPPDSELDPDDLRDLRANGRAVRVSRTLHYHPDTIERVRTEAIALAAADGGSFTLARFRDQLGTSRKFAEALLNHLDSERVTIRRGDQHELRKRS
jgi:selenocysteine-specific elongation factor